VKLFYEFIGRVNIRINTVDGGEVRPVEALADDWEERAVWICEMADMGDDTWHNLIHDGIAIYPEFVEGEPTPTDVGAYLSTFIPNTHLLPDIYEIVGKERQFVASWESCKVPGSDCLFFRQSLTFARYCIHLFRPNHWVWRLPSGPMGWTKPEKPETWEPRPIRVVHAHESVNQVAVHVGRGVELQYSNPLNPLPPGERFDF